MTLLVTLVATPLAALAYSDSFVKTSENGVAVPYYDSQYQIQYYNQYYSPYQKSYYRGPYSQQYYQPIYQYPYQYSQYQTYQTYSNSYPYNYNYQYPYSYTTYPYYNSYTPLTVSCSASQPQYRYGQSYITWNAYATGGNGGYHYTWTGTDNPNNQDNSVLNFYYATPGWKYMNVTVTSGGESATANCGGAYFGGNGGVWY